MLTLTPAIAQVLPDGTVVGANDPRFVRPAEWGVAETKPSVAVNNPSPTIIPTYPPNTGVVSAGTINSATSQQPREWQLASIAAVGQVIPLVYGEYQVSAKYLDAFVYGSTIYLVILWALGACVGVQKITDSNGDALPNAVTMRHYDGSQTTVDARLKTAFEAVKKLPFNANLNRRAYSVFEIGTAANVDPSNFKADIKGMRLFDPRSATQSVDDPATWQWSDNAALCLADFISNTRYGWGKKLDWASVADAADYCDEIVGGNKRWTLNYAIIERQSTMQLIELLRAYAHCWVKRRGDIVRLIPDRPGAVDFSLTQAQVIGTPQIVRRGVEALPTVVIVSYTDKTKQQEQDFPAYAHMPGTHEGTLRWAESKVTMPGINTYQEAMREATERLLKLQHGDTEINANIRDIGIELEAGDLVQIPHPTYPEGKIYRLTANPALIGAAKYKINGVEYQPEAYSNDVFLPPSIPDTTLPDPSHPPAVENLQVVERLTRIGGVWTSTLLVTWARPVWAYLLEYVVEISNRGIVLSLDTVPIESFISAAVAEDEEYIVRVRVKSRTFQSEWTLATIVALGKYLPPSDVERFTEALNANGAVHLAWTEAHDIDPITYEVRRIADDGSGDLNALWSAATVLASTVAPRVALALQPPGAWLYLVKALDTVGNYSLNPAAVKVFIKIDDDTRFIDTWKMNIVSTQEVTRWETLADSLPRWTSDRGEPMNYGHAVADDSVGTFGEFKTLPFALPCSGGASEVVSQFYDVGVVVGGTWTARANITDHAEPSELVIELSNNAINWEQFSGGGGECVAERPARFARLRIRSAGAYTLTDLPTLTLAAIPRVESGEIMVGATGTYTVRTTGRYKGYVGDSPIDLEYIGEMNYTPERGAISIAADDTARFDVFLRDEYGERVNGRVRWTFRGV